MSDLNRSAMKSLLQIFMIGAGSLSFLISAPIIIYGYMMYRGFGGDLTNKDRLLLSIPFLALALIAAGVIWRKSDQKEDEPRA